MRMKRTGRSRVSAITQTPASGPFRPVTTPPMSSLSMATACCACNEAGATQPTTAIPIAATPVKRILRIVMPPCSSWSPSGITREPRSSQLQRHRVNYPRCACEQITPECAMVKTPQYWRRGSESNRRPRLCRPLHDHSATPPHARDWEQRRISRTGCSFEDSGAGEESRTPDLNLGKVTLYQLSYSREQGGILRAAPPAVKPAAVSFRARRQGEFQIVKHRHQRQYRGDIDEPRADALRTEHADPLVIEQKRHGDHLGDRFYLPEEVHRDAFRLADLRHPLA